MEVPRFEIESARAGREKRPVKSRAFSVHLLGYVRADALWEGTVAERSFRPAWLGFVGTEAASRAFTANLRGGRVAVGDGDRFQLPRKARYRWLSQRGPEGTVTVAYLPELFDLEPVGPEADIRFVFAPPVRWVAARAAELAPEFGDEATDVARAALFAAYLDRRTHLPVVADLRFQLHLYRAALAEDWVHESGGYRCDESPLHVRRFAPCGLEEPRACLATATEFETFLVRETHRFYEEEIRHGSTRLAAGRRLLSGAAFAPAQLCLAFDLA